MKQPWKVAALHLAQSTDMSWREIAKRVGKAKSTVSDFLRVAIPAGSGPRIGILDIETSPTLAWVWRRWKENIGPVQVEEETIILSVAVKELGSTEIDFCASWQSGELEDDSNVAEFLYDQLSKYDILIAHNGDKFDFPIINTRLVYHGYTPPAPYKTVDTLKTLKKRFKFPSNSLNAVCGYLGLGSKVPHSGFELWKSVMHHDPVAMATMEEYNIGDVVLLEELYLHIRAWENTHPSIAARTETDDCTCNACGSGNLSPTSEKWTTAVSSFTLYQCGDCGHWQRDRVNTIPKEQRDNLMVSVK